MPDLTVVAVLTAKPGSEAVLQNALESLVEPTRAEEGCLSYELHHSVTDPTTFITIEQWRGQSDLDAHMQTPHIAQALQAGRRCLRRRTRNPSAGPDQRLTAPAGQALNESLSERSTRAGDLIARARLDGTGHRDPASVPGWRGSQVTPRSASSIVWSTWAGDLLGPSLGGDVLGPHERGAPGRVGPGQEVLGDEWDRASRALLPGRIGPLSRRPPGGRCASRHDGSRSGRPGSGRAPRPRRWPRARPHARRGVVAPRRRRGPRRPPWPAGARSAGAGRFDRGSVYLPVGR